MCRTYDGFPNKRLHLHRVNNVGSGCAVFVVRVVICFVVAGFVVVVVIVIMQTTSITPTTPMELITIQIILLTTVLSSISSEI